MALSKFAFARLLRQPNRTNKLHRHGSFHHWRSWLCESSLRFMGCCSFGVAGKHRLNQGTDGTHRSFNHGCRTDHRHNFGTGILIQNIDARQVIADTLCIFGCSENFELVFFQTLDERTNVGRIIFELHGYAKLGG